MTEDLRPIHLVFEEDMSFERIAEFVQLLSELYGEELDVVSVSDMPPIPKRLRDVA